MNRQFFNTQYAALLAAFPNVERTDISREIYWDMLKDVPEKEFGDGVRKCLATCKFFPTIAELGSASLPTKRVFGPWNAHGESYRDLDWREQTRINEKAKLSSGKIVSIEDRRKE